MIGPGHGLRWLCCIHHQWPIPTSESWLPIINCLNRWLFRTEEKDVATAILRRKSAPNKLIVDEALQDDNSVVHMSENTLEKLGLFRSDTILLKGKKRRETVAVVLTSPECDDQKIRLNKGKPYILFNIELTGAVSYSKQSSCKTG